eukprot:scaffold11976_cov101-Isochrysis_galbana.AAC.2
MPPCPPPGNWKNWAEAPPKTAHATSSRAGSIWRHSVFRARRGPSSHTSADAAPRFLFGLLARAVVAFCF